MEEALIRFLLADPALAALVGNRIHWRRRPQSETALPAIVLSLVGFTGQMTNEGLNGFQNDRVQVDCYGETYLSARAVANRVEALMKAIRSPVADWRLQSAELVLRADFDEQSPAAETRLFRRTADFSIWHKAA